MILGGPLGSQGGSLGIPGGSPLGIPGGPLGRLALGHGPMGPLGRLALWTRAHGPRAHGPRAMGPGTRNEYNVNGFLNYLYILYNFYVKPNIDLKTPPYWSYDKMD